jgi:hypothetical protein
MLAEESSGSTKSRRWDCRKRIACLENEDLNTKIREKYVCTEKVAALKEPEKLEEKL